MKNPPPVLWRAYVALLSLHWPERGTATGQALLSDLRDTIACSSGIPPQTVQEIAEADAHKAAEEAAALAEVHRIEDGIRTLRQVNLLRRAGL